MSNTIDQRIVEMQFDNKDFERNVQTSVKTLDKLKDSLHLEQSAKELSALSKAGKSFNLDSMVSAADTVIGKFSVMGTIGDQVLRRITDSAFNAFNKIKGFVESLTIQPISTGMDEYETQINAIQTIMSNTRDKMTKAGYSDAERLEIVNDRLDQLNHYADKTIYNFTEMTRNIGTFTAAGVELDTAVNSIQGVANLAAVSGSTSEQASRGMYQLSQAISTGTVKLQDWNSVVNAGMGGELFQKALIRTAMAQGVTIDKTVKETDKNGKKITKTVKMNAEQIVEAEGSFRESLSTGWLTTDVLTATLEQLSWDFEQIAKDTILTDENRESFIEQLANAYVGDGMEAAEARKKAEEMLGGMTELSIEAAKELKKAELLAQGYSLSEADEIIQLAQDATEAATKVKTLSQLFDTLKEAAQSGWTQTWEYIIGDFEEAKETLTSISKYFGGIIEASAEARNAIVKEWHDNGGRDMLFNNDVAKGELGAFWNIVHGIQNIIGIVREEFQKIFPPTTSKNLLDFTKNIQQATANFKAWTENSEAMEKIRRIIAGVAAGFGLIRDGIGYVWNGFKGLFGLAGSAGNGLLDFAAGLGDTVANLKDSLKSSEKFKNILGNIDKAAAKVKENIVTAFTWIKTKFSDLWNQIKASGMLTKISDGISSFVEKLPEAIDSAKAWGKTIVSSVKNSETLKKAWTNIKKFLDPAIQGILAFGKKLKTALKAFFEKDTSGEESMWDKLKARLSAFGESFSDWFGDVKAKATEVWGKIKDFISTFFTKTIPDFFNSAKVTGSGFIDRIKEMDWGKVIKTAIGIASIAKVFQLIKGISQIGKISKAFENLTDTVKDIVKNGASLTKDGLFINGKKKNSMADTLLKIAGAIGILVGSFYVLSKMDTDSILKGMGIIAVLAGGLLIVAEIFKKIDIDGGSILKISGALLLMVIPIKLLSMMAWGEALKGIAMVGIIFAELGLLSKMIPQGFNGKSAGFIGLSVAVNILVLAVKSLAGMNVGELMKGIVALGVILAEIGGFAKIAGGAGKVSGLIGMAVALTLMIIPIKVLSGMKMSNLGKGLLGLGGIVAAFAVIAKTTKGIKVGGVVAFALALSTTIGVFALALDHVKDIDWKVMLSFSVGLSVLMASMAGIMALLGNLSPAVILKGSIGLIALAAVIGVVVEILGALLGDAFTNFAGKIFQVGANLKAFSNTISDLNIEAINKSITVMKDLGGAAAGLALLDLSGASNFQTALRQIGSGLNLYYTLIKDIDVEKASGSMTMANDIYSIVTTMNELSSVSVDIESLGEVFANIGSGLKLYNESLSAETTGESGGSANTTYIKQAFDDLAQNLPTSEVVAQISSYAAGGGNDMTSFALGITAIGSAISSFSTSIANVDFKSTLHATNFLSVISVIQSGLPSYGGILEFFTGKQQTLGEFSDNIVALGGAISSFGTSIKDIDESKMTQATNAISMLSEIQSGLEKEGGVLSFFTGNKDLGDFSEKLNPLGEALKGFSDNISGIDADNMLNATAPIDALVNIQSKLDETGGVAQWFSGSKDLSNFGNSVKSFGEDLKSFADSASGITANDNQQLITDTINLFAGIAERMNGLDKVYDLSDFIKWIGADLKTFFSGLKGVDMSSSETLSTFVNSIADAAVLLQGVEVDNWKLTELLSELTFPELPEDGYSSLANEMPAALGATVEAVLGTETSFSDAGDTLGGALATGLVTGIQNGSDDIKTAASNSSSFRWIDAVQSRVNWYLTGQYLARGLSSGISSMAGSVRTAAINAASGAIRAIQIIWDINSPSRVGEKLGMNLDFGIAGGIDKYAKYVSKSSEGVGESVIKSAKTMLRGVDSSIFDYIDPNPTIRPVLDLSNVQDGASLIGGMFGQQQVSAIGLFRGMSFERNVNGLNFDGAKIAGGMTDKNIVSKLETLETRIGELNESMSNMKLVLDTGALVGATSAKMDSQLGVLATRRGRGN